MPEFAHLHVHSEYSLLDGLSRIPKLVERTKEMGMPALALTDHGVMHGVIEFYRAAKAQGIKPLLGCELYVARRRRDQRESDKDSRPYHLTVLAKDQTGYKNLMVLCTKAQLEGFYYKPRVDRELLEQYHEGLVVLSGCGSAEIPRWIREGQLDKARETIGWFLEVFGRDNFFLELQKHDLDWIDAVNRELIAFSKAFDVPLVATNDVHYLRKEDAYTHEVLLCIQTNTTMNDPKRMRYGDTYYLRSPEEMAALFAEVPEALHNTLRIAEMCDVEIKFGEYHLPHFDVPEGYTPETYLRHLCEEGLKRRYPQITPEIRARLDHELKIIHMMGFDTYFLIVWDLCRFARERGIWWNVRGSAAGSIVAYTLGITNLDPLKHDLIFERFLNPGRVTMPDIDLDFPDDQRDQLIQYTFDKYGHDHVAQIITFGTMGARAAIRDAGRALDLPVGEVDQVARLVPAIPGMPKTIDEALEEVPELRQLYESKDYIRNLIDTARGLEGVARHASTHAAGVVVADAPLVNYTPLHRPTKGDESGAVVTQFSMEILESIGLLKIDFLGLSTLTIMRKACELIEQRHGVKLTLETIPVDDPAIYELLSSGEVTGIFQVEGAGMRRVLTSMQPKRFEDIVAVLSLYRPGPMEHIPDYIDRMHGRKQVEYRHPDLEPILKETYGIIVYQEQIIRIATNLAGYAPGDADTIRKAVGKKKREELLKHREKFVQGAKARGIPEEVANAIFDDIEYFARYGFNKAHASDYAVITCQTAYLKAKYPLEYMTAMLSVERGNTDKIALLVADCQRMGIPIYPPDVNHSALDFTIEGEGIRFGLGAIKNVGEGPVQAILSARGDKPFRDLDDFCRRVDLRQVNRRALECLIRVGALDCFGRREQLLAVIDRMMSVSQQAHQAQEIGQLTMFDLAPGFATSGSNGMGFDHLPDVPEIPYKERLAWEKELAGVYLSEHPLHRLVSQVEDTITALCGQIDETMVGQSVIVAGMISSVRTITTKKGDPMAFAQLEDLQGSIEVVVFPRVYEQTRDLWVEDNLIVLNGRVEERDGKIQIIANAATAYNPEELGVHDTSPAAGPPGEHPQEESRPDRQARAPSPPQGESQPVPQDVHPPAQPSAAEQVPATTPAAKGNGTVVPALASDRSRPTYYLKVTLPRSDDPEQDITRLGEVFHLLCSYEGQDRFSLFVDQGDRRIQLEFPNHTTRYCVGLVHRIEEILGPGSVHVTHASN